MFEALSKLTVESERLTIRRFEECDLPAVYEIHKVDIVNEYLPYSTWKSWVDAEKWLSKMQQRQKNLDARQFVIQHLNTHEIVGTIIVFSPNLLHRNIEIGYVLGFEYWNNGYMYEALDCFIPKLVERLQLTKITASIEQKNHGSNKLIKKLGFAEFAREYEDGGVALIRYQRLFAR